MSHLLFASKTQPRRQERAQILVFFALSMVGLAALAGIVLDGGMLYLERRTAQNAADAAALAGLRVMVQANVSTTMAGTNPPGIRTEIERYVASNTFGPSTQLVCAYFVQANSTAPVAGGAAIADNGCSTVLSGQELSDATTAPVACSSPAGGVVPCLAAGIHVDTRIGPYATYLLGIVGQGSATVDAHATAHIGVLQSVDGDNAPVAGCGDMMPKYGVSNQYDKLVGPNPYPTPNPTPVVPRLASPTDPTQNQFGRAYVLADSNALNNQATPPCPSTSSNNSNSWKGRLRAGNDGVNDGAITLPANVTVDPGLSSGPLADSMIAACTRTLQQDPSSLTSPPTLSTSKCKLVIPIASVPPGCGPDDTASPPCPAVNEAYVVALACFDIFRPNANSWGGVLLPPGTPGCASVGTFETGGTFQDITGGATPVKVMLSS